MSMPRDANVISDVYDGELFQELLNSEDGQYIIKNEGFTFLINTDGISLSTKSETSIWPVMLVIDQIKSGERFCLENVIFAGKGY
jgi:heptaprenylglyceryl phosphate synthase